MGSKKNPLAYTGRVPGSTKVRGDVQFNSTQFSVTDGIVSLAGGGLAVDSLSGDSGSATPNASGNIEIAGGTNITTSAATNTVTINMDAAISLATSVTSPLYTTSAADMDIVAAAGQDIDVFLGDDAGVKNFAWHNQSGTQVAYVTSQGLVYADGIVSVPSNNFQINAAAGFNLVMRAGDAAGANYFIWEDSAGADQMNLDSNGQLNLLTGNLVESRSAAAAEVLMQVTNSDNTDPASDAFFEAAVGGTSSGNPGIRFQISGGQNYSMGIDNASAADDLLICGDNDIGTDPLLRLEEAGNVTLEKGNLVLNAAATQLRMQGGAATDFIGTATLTAGTVTVANTNIAAGDRIFIQRQSANSSTAIGHLTYTISAGASFTITSLQAAAPGSTETNDVSIVVYHIIREI